MLLLYPVLECNYYITVHHLAIILILIRSEKIKLSPHIGKHHSHRLPTEKVIKQITSIKEQRSYLETEFTESDQILYVHQH